MKITQVEIHPDALDEAEAAVSWYVERSSRAPVAFIEEIDKAIKSILNTPKRWPIFESDFRRVPLFRFPYFIVYRENQTI
jgi:plasmid stabilization system protein ParE